MDFNKPNVFSCISPTSDAPPKGSFRKVTDQVRPQLHLGRCDFFISLAREVLNFMVTGIANCQRFKHNFKGLPSLEGRPCRTTCCSAARGECLCTRTRPAVPPDPLPSDGQVRGPRRCLQALKIPGDRLVLLSSPPRIPGTYSVESSR